MRLAGKKIAYLVEEGFEDLEFWVPVMRLREEGAHVVIVGTGRQKVSRGAGSSRTFRISAASLSLHSKAAGPEVRSI